MNEASSFALMAIGGVVLFLFFIVSGIFMVNEFYENKKQRDKSLNDIRNKNKIESAIPFKCQCDNENIVMMECAHCHQPSRGCSNCWRRLSPCVCDEVQVHQDFLANPLRYPDEDVEALGRDFAIMLGVRVHSEDPKHCGRRWTTRSNIRSFGTNDAIPSVSKKVRYWNQPIQQQEEGDLERVNAEIEEYRKALRELDDAELKPQVQYWSDRLNGADQSKVQYWSDLLNRYRNNRKPHVQKFNVDREVQKAKALRRRALREVFEEEMGHTVKPTDHQLFKRVQRRSEDDISSIESSHSEPARTTRSYRNRTAKSDWTALMKWERFQEIPRNKRSGRRVAFDECRDQQNPSDSHLEEQLKISRDQNAELIDNLATIKVQLANAQRKEGRKSRKQCDISRQPVRGLESQEICGNDSAQTLENQLAKMINLMKHDSNHSFRRKRKMKLKRSCETKEVPQTICEGYQHFQRHCTDRLNGCKNNEKRHVQNFNVNREVQRAKGLRLRALEYVNEEEIGHTVKPTSHQSFTQVQRRTEDLDQANAEIEQFRKALRELNEEDLVNQPVKQQKDRDFVRINAEIEEYKNTLQVLNEAEMRQRPKRVQRRSEDLKQANAEIEEYRTALQELDEGNMANQPVQRQRDRYVERMNAEIDNIKNAPEALQPRTQPYPKNMDKSNVDPQLIQKRKRVQRPSEDLEQANDEIEDLRMALRELDEEDMEPNLT